MATQSEKDEFLRKDLADALKWLVVGAIMWRAADTNGGKAELCPHQRAVGMFTSLVQARALYEFYYGKDGRPDDARLRQVSSWTPKQSTLYADYFANEKPANKRVFHLVYGRSMHSSGDANNPNDPRHINNRVLDFAEELWTITKEFVNHVDDATLRGEAERAFKSAGAEAETTAASYGVKHPFTN
jgi:hypothetical protein